MNYADLGEDAQVDLLKGVALRALTSFDLSVRALEVVEHGYNTTFGLVTTSGDRFAVRVNVNSKSTSEHVQAQVAWTRALSQESAILVPEPVATPVGDHLVHVTPTGLDRAFDVTVSTWLEGADVGEPDAVQARELGAVMALLHTHARGWRMPPGACLTTFDEPLFHDPDVLEHACVDSQGAAVIARARSISTDAFSAMFQTQQPIVIHGDLHGDNLKWHEGQMAVFDFDDCGLGTPALDLAISTFYLRGREQGLEEELRAGYAEVCPVPQVAPELFEGLVAGRQLLLANALLASNTANLRQESEQYLRTSVERLERWLHTGRFCR